jgi:hypothetical protein
MWVWLIAYPTRYGIYTEPPETIISHLSYGSAVVEFLDELWIDTATIVAVADSATKQEIIEAMMQLVTRPPYNPGGETVRCVWVVVGGCC